MLEIVEGWDGVPWAWVFDNMKTVTLGRDADGQPRWNPAFWRFATEAGFHPEVRDPRPAQQKGSVENLVKWVKTNFLPGRSFVDDEDLAQQSRAWERDKGRPGLPGSPPAADRSAVEHERVEVNVELEAALAAYPGGGGMEGGSPRSSGPARIRIRAFERTILVTDTIREVDWYPDDPAMAEPEYAPHRAWADRLATGEALVELERTIAAQDPSRSVALVRSYQQRTAERDPLIRMLVHCAGKFQGDAHIFRNARSVIEEYYLNSASPGRKDVLFQAWAHYLAFYKKRTLSTECYELYHHHFGS